ncbi:OLC1v1016490C1 [Oldenlandia corymbosa var. corymbosa]|uniref:OLC1v1016490C1 n=1 Tax=Oldenlandia corymbosa var. corymbosa TaxID=529605 RepID=A0AAV1E5S9_OLDCO|nr:OLC1v1016490C1 [Oldenlandia corymbosa var. corymbosa]
MDEKRTLAEIKSAKLEAKDAERVAMQTFRDKSALLEVYTKASIKLYKQLVQMKAKQHQVNSAKIIERDLNVLEANTDDLAQRVFNAVPSPYRRRKDFLWNQLIRAYAWEGPFKKAIDLYHEMVDFGVKPTNYTYPVVLKACAALRDTETGVKIHGDLERLGLGADVFVCTALVDFYVKCGCLGQAWEVFDGMPHRDIVAWNAMIAGCAAHGLFGDVLGLVLEMQEEGVSPNSSTLVTILPVIGEANEVTLGKAVHGLCLRKGVYGDVVVGTALLDMYGRCGLLNYARRIFDGMSLKNEVTWSAMVGACITCDSMEDGLQLFRQMRAENSGDSPSPVALAAVIRGFAKLIDVEAAKQLHGYTLKLGSILDLMVGNTLLSLYAKCGIINDALRFFEEMNFKDSVSYSALISGCVQNGMAEEALKLFRKMWLFGVEPESATIMGLFPACSYLAALRPGRCAHGFSIRRGFTEDVSVSNALVDMYAKCGKIDVARIVFNKMHKRDVVSWNAMIIGYGIHGLGLEAISLFQNMLVVGQKPDDVTFISLLSACSHAGLIAEGMQWFHSMGKQFSIKPRIDHYLCIVDLLSRGGSLEDAYKIIREMPLEPDIRIWNALLSACRIYKKVELVEEISNKIQSLGPEGTGNLVLLSNIYSTAGRWDDAADVRVMQKGLGFKKIPGSSWIEVDRVIHAFLGGDQSHPESARIHAKLLELQAEMKKMGYSAEANFVYQDVEEEEKELILLYHSEKLAVAFGLLNIHGKSPILVTKNLRVCGDCHTALKIITIITERRITLRDTVRFHHFYNGKCSCGDFW